MRWPARLHRIPARPSGRPQLAPTARSTSTSSRRSCRTSPSPTGTRGQLAARAGRQQGPGRYGTADAGRVAGRLCADRPRAGRDRQLGFPGYFLIVHDIVPFCARERHPVPGPGSAANSAVCYALGITSADPVAARPALRAVPVRGPERPARHRPGHRAPPPGGGHPGRLPTATAGSNAAKMANVISYRPRMALRDAGRVFGLPAHPDAWTLPGRRPAASRGLEAS